MDLDLNLNSRLTNKKGSVVGSVIVGILFIILGIRFIFLNESNSLKNIKAINEASKAAIEIDAEEFLEENEGKVVCVSGKLQILSGEVKDNTFSLSLNTTQIYRKVEMYQWEEEEDNTNDRTEYTYKKVWSEKIIDSSKFYDTSYQNPYSMKYTSQYFDAKNVKLGKYSMGSEQIIDLSTPDSYTDFSNINIPYGFKQNDKYITNSSSPSNPQIGDIRISFYYNSSDTATVLAKQQGNGFADFESANGVKINEAANGIKTKEDMISKMQSDNKIFTWIIRIVLVIVEIIGFSLLFSPIIRLTSWIPVAGRATRSVSSLIGFLLGIIVSFSCIAIAWVAYRPIIAVILLVIGAIVAIIVISAIKRKKASASQSTTNSFSVNDASNNYNNSQMGSQDFVEQTNSPKTCKYCGAKNDSNLDKCQNCGGDL